jgi:hypothetical protein
MATATSMNLFGGENDTGPASFAGLAVVAIKFWKAPIGLVALTLDSIAVVSAEKDANEFCTKLIYGD